MFQKSERAKHDDLWEDANEKRNLREKKNTIGSMCVRGRERGREGERRRGSEGDREVKT